MIVSEGSGNWTTSVNLLLILFIVSQWAKCLTGCWKVWEKDMVPRLKEHVLCSIPITSVFQVSNCWQHSSSWFWWWELKPSSYGDGLWFFSGRRGAPAPAGFCGQEGGAGPGWGMGLLTQQSRKGLYWATYSCDSASRNNWTRRLCLGTNHSDFTSPYYTHVPACVWTHTHTLVC